MSFTPFLALLFSGNCLASGIYMRQRAMTNSGIADQEAFRQFRIGGFLNTVRAVCLALLILSEIPNHSTHYNWLASAALLSVIVLGIAAYQMTALSFRGQDVVLLVTITASVLLIGSLLYSRTEAAVEKNTRTSLTSAITGAPETKK